MGTTYNPFQYTGTYLDGTGLYQMGARYYQSASGRFTQLDPLPKNLLTFDRYAYVSCNPANFVDPTGLVPEVVGECLKGAFIGAIGGAVFGAIQGAILGAIGAPVTAGLSVVGSAVIGAGIGEFAGAISGCATGVAAYYVAD